MKGSKTPFDMYRLCRTRTQIRPRVPKSARPIFPQLQPETEPNYFSLKVHNIAKQRKEKKIDRVTKCDLGSKGRADSGTGGRIQVHVRHRLGWDMGIAKIRHS